MAVLGAGSFGTCLALLCSRENDVRLWARNPELADAINAQHRNPRYLTEIELPASVRATADIEEALASAKKAREDNDLTRAQEARDKLERATIPLAADLMDSMAKKALAGKSIDEV